MKNLRKDNKGFSLVELIVVVLIMAIIAVALAPQILKWVNNSRISTDNDTMQQAISNLQTALTYDKAYEEAKKGTHTLEITNSGITTGTGKISYAASATGDPSASTTYISWKFSEYSGISANTDIKTKTSGKKITITVDTNGKVTGTFDGGSIEE